MSRDFEGARGTANEILAEAVAKELRPVYCARCGSRLQVRKLQQNGFDKDTGYPKYDVILGCPHAILYETSVLGKPWFTWKKPFGRHTVHKVSKVIELNSDITDAYYKPGDAMSFCPDCGTNVSEGALFCSECGNQLLAK